MADQNSTPTKEYLQSIFEYRDGNLYWKEHQYRNKVKGKVAGSLTSNNYIRIAVNKKYYLAHRLIFLFHYGFLPKKIDHIDTNTLNNKIENLRAATSRQNNYNCKLSKRNKSGYKNVFWNKDRKKWQVILQVDGKQKYFGLYFDKEVANFVAKTMRYKYHKEFANNG